MKNLIFPWHRICEFISMKLSYSLFLVLYVLIQFHFKASAQNDFSKNAIVQLKRREESEKIIQKWKLEEQIKESQNNNALPYLHCPIRIDFDLKGAGKGGIEIYKSSGELFIKNDIYYPQYPFMIFEACAWPIDAYTVKIIGDGEWKQTLLLHWDGHSAIFEK